jgi:hypothetical protein
LQKINALPTQPAAQETNALEIKDIHVPEQISNYPIAYGWWLLAALLILVTAISIIKIRKKAKLNHVKQQALVQLKSNPEMPMSDTIALLKWAAIHYFSRVELAKLFGSSLQEFLTTQLPIKHKKDFIDLSEQAFLNQYHAKPKANVNADIHVQSGKNFNQAAILWLTHALPPKTLKVTNKSVNISKNDNQGVSA